MKSLIWKKNYARHIFLIIAISVKTRFKVNTLSANVTKWSNTLKKLFECVWPFCEIDALKLNQSKVLEIQTRSCRIHWLWKLKTFNVFNPFVPNVLFPYPWKRQKTWNETLGENELILLVKVVLRTQTNMYEGAFKWISLAAKTTV